VLEETDAGAEEQLAQHKKVLAKRKVGDQNFSVHYCGQQSRIAHNVCATQGTVCLYVPMLRPCYHPLQEVSHTGRQL
jgi:hypothetical protein